MLVMLPGGASPGCKIYDALIIKWHMPKDSVKKFESLTGKCSCVRLAANALTDSVRLSTLA